MGGQVVEAAGVIFDCGDSLGGAFYFGGVDVLVDGVNLVGGDVLGWGDI